MIDTPIVIFLNTYGVLLLFVVVLTYLWFVEKKKKEVLRIIFASILAGTVALIAKELFALPRPYLINGNQPLAGHFTTSSFPSLHTALAFALATTIALHQKKMGLLLFLVALLIGIGRMLANVHYLIDVASGALIGILIALFIDKFRTLKS